MTDVPFSPERMKKFAQSAVLWIEMMSHLHRIENPEDSHLRFSEESIERLIIMFEDGFDVEFSDENKRAIRLCVKTPFYDFADAARLSFIGNHFTRKDVENVIGAYWIKKRDDMEELGNMAYERQYGK